MASASVTAETSRKGSSLKKLHALSGVVPLGAFVVLHVWITASIVGSRAIYDHQVGLVHSGILGVLEPLVILPLLFHAAYGVVLAAGPRDPEHTYDTDLMAGLQRASGVVVLLFIGLHLWEFRWQTWTHGLPESAYSTKLVADLSSTRWGVPWISLGYIVGMAGSVFHLVNGMTSFCTKFGYTSTAATQARARLLFRVAGILLFAISSGIVVQLATGTRLFPATKPTWPAFECGPAALPSPLPSHAIPAATAPRVAPPSSPSSSSPPLPSGGH